MTIYFIDDTRLRSVSAYTVSSIIDRDDDGENDRVRDHQSNKPKEVAAPPSNDNTPTSAGTLTPLKRRKRESKSSEIVALLKKQEQQNELTAATVSQQHAGFLKAADEML